MPTQKKPLQTLPREECAKEKGESKEELSIVPKTCLEKLFSRYPLFTLIASNIYYNTKVLEMLPVPYERIHFQSF